MAILYLNSTPEACSMVNFPSAAFRIGLP